MFEIAHYRISITGQNRTEQFDGFATSLLRLPYGRLRRPNSFPTNLSVPGHYFILPCSISKMPATAFSSLANRTEQTYGYNVSSINYT
jgi:hypothetical protein